MASLWERSTPTTLRISLGLQIILPKMKPLDWDQDRKTAGTSNCSTKYTQLSWGMESTTEKYITTRVIIVHWNTVFDKFLTDKVYQILLSEWNHFFTYWHIQTVMQNDVDQNHVEFLPLPCSYLFPANRPVWRKPGFISSSFMVNIPIHFTFQLLNELCAERNAS